MLSVLRTGAMRADSAAEGLQAAGYFGEAAALRSAGALDWAFSESQLGRVATCLDADYPARWLEVLGDRAPPALWCLGGSEGAPCVGVVGSRDVEPDVHRFCAAVGREAVRLGYRVASGGAIGCDSAALQAASEGGGETLLLAPYGIDRFEDEPPSGQTVLSAAEPSAVFSRPLAMERNALIYAASRVCVVGQVRFREGGTWHGASDALRRRLCPILVRKPDREDPEEAVRGARALVALGARYLECPRELGKAIDSLPMEEGLFRFGGASGVA